MDRLAGVLDRRETQHVDLAGFRIDANIGEVDGEAGTGTARVQRRTTQQRPAGASRRRGDLRERQRLQVAR